MNTINVPAATRLPDSFSWQRLAMLARFYGPSIRMALLLYPVVSIALGITCYMLNHFELGMVFSGLLSTILAVMFYFFPLLFTRGSVPVIDTILPVTVLERLTFFIIACIPANFLITYGLYYGTQGLLSCIIQPGAIQSLLDQIAIKTITQTYGSNWFQALPPLVTCMYVVMTSVRGTTGKAIGWTIATIVVLTVIGGIAGGIAVLCNEEFLQIMATNIKNDSMEAGIESSVVLLTILRPVLIITSIACMLYSCFMTWLAYRNMKCRQI